MLQAILKEVLPQDSSFEILHLQSPPSESAPLVNNTSKQNRATTIKTEHLFCLAYKGRIFYGLELYVYITCNHDNEVEKTERLVFVSKADTNGYCDIRVNIKLVTLQLIRYVLSINPDYYLHRVIPKERDYKKSGRTNLITKATNSRKALKILADRLQNHSLIEPEIFNAYYTKFHSGKELVTKIALFTRPADQYLFPNSSKNPNKHNLDGDGLLKWWASLLDNLLVSDFNLNKTKAKIRIPGEDKYRFRRYTNALKCGIWTHGDIFSDNDSDSVIKCIPMFPDDPKSRFMKQLFEENRIQTTSLDTFWTELQERQEFKLSVVVSVMGISGIYEIDTNYKPSTDVYRCRSKRQFHCIKNYITGEEYDTEEGALESYQNVNDYLSREGTSLLTVIGNADYSKFKQNRTTTSTPVVVNTLQVRRKK